MGLNDRQLDRDGSGTGRVLPDQWYPSSESCPNIWLSQNSEPKDLRFIVIVPKKKREQSWVLSTLRQARAAIQLNKHGDEVSTLVHPKPHSIHNHASQCGKPKNRPNPSFPEMGGIDSSIDHPPSGGFNVNLPR